MPRDDPIPPSFQNLRSTRAVNRSPMRHPPRILHIIPALNAGGAQRQLVNLAVGLSKKKLDVSVLTLDPLQGAAAFLAPELHSLNIPVHALNTLPDPSRSALNAIPAIADLAKELSTDLKPLTFSIARMLINNPPDVVHAWLDLTNITAALAALMLKVPRIILSTRSVNPTHFPDLNIPWFQPWYRFLASIDDLTFINNSSAGSHDYADWLGLPAARFQVIRNGIDLAAYRSVLPEQVAAFRKELQLTPNDQLLTGVFRLSAEKQPFLFLETALAVMRDRPALHTAILGHGPLESELRSRIAQSPLRARINLLAPRTDMPVVYAATNVLLQTSLLEGTPNTLLEAQAMGCPVVTLPGGGAIECLLDQTTGFLAATTHDLAQGVSRILDHHDLRARLSANGPAFIHDRFNLQRMIDACLDLYTAPACRAEE